MSEKELDLTPPAAVAQNAEKGLELRGKVWSWWDTNWRHPRSSVKKSRLS